MYEIEAFAPQLREGMIHQAAGRLAEAAESYHRAHLDDPGDADALLLLGILARQTKHFAAAVQLTALAVQRRPQAAHFHLNLALARLAAGDADCAAESCHRSLALDAGNAEAWRCLGKIETQRENAPAARAAYEHALKIPSGAAAAALELGNLLCRQEKYEEALRIYAVGIRHTPANANLFLALGAAAAMAGRTDVAKDAYCKALALKPAFPEAYLNLGNLLYDEGSFPAAAACYWRAIGLRPGYAKAYCNLGNALSSLGQYPAAVVAYERALKCHPESAATQHNLGNALLHRRDYARAEECFRHALRLESERAEHHNSLGNALLQQHRVTEAEECYRKALELKHDYATAHINLANVLLQLRRPDEMQRHYRRGLELDPASPGGQYNLALACLREGNYREGWQRHESRWEFRELNLQRRNFTQPQWTGQPLGGETILLHAEQGLGDTLQFIRYAPLVAARGGRVVLEVQPRLQTLLETIDGVDHVLTRGDPLPEFSFHCPLMSLPLAFQTTLDTIPSTTPYIRPDPDEVAAAWRAYPRQGERLRVGLAWAGNPRFKADRLRSTSLRTLLPLAEIGEVAFFSLQFGPAAAQIRPLQDQFPLIDACSRNQHFGETAAIAATLDLVISVDTSVAHLAGAMGLPVWILLPHLADWRWLEDREDTPWYPTARLFRQPAPGDWRSLSEEARDALRLLLQNLPVALPKTAYALGETPETGHLGDPRHLARV